jgi:hypothetical protein
VLTLLGDDTNWTYVAPVMADGAGSVNLRYRYSRTGNATSAGCSRRCRIC